ncbi:MAG TPA: helix-turn-helix domain-containing protein [Gaiellaceae bacterium]|nr:helix-turn-helix domain-containing protein [Gaiellaceae bacterium]
MPRKYELRRRAERVAETRRRIVAAAVDLHTTLGPARTTVSAVAERAGVQRHTVYAHFPHERDLFRACSAHWAERHPFPDPARWLVVEDPLARLRRALGDVYAWYAEVEDDLALFARDAHALPPEVAERTEAEQRELADLLARRLPRRKAVRAAVGHALAFETWRSLVRTEGLSRAQAIELMVRLVEDA